MAGFSFGSGTAAQDAIRAAQSRADMEKQRQQALAQAQEATKIRQQDIDSSRATNFESTYTNTGGNGQPYQQSYGGSLNAPYQQPASLNAPYAALNPPKTSSGSASSSGGGGGGMTANALATAMAQLQSSIGPQVAPPAHVAAPTPPMQNGPTLAYSQAKDASGRTGSAAVRALHELMSRRGFADSGLETAGESSILSDVARQQSGAEYDAAAKNADQMWEGAKLGYQGDIGQNETAYQGNMAQRNQNQQMMLNLLSRLQY